MRANVWQQLNLENSDNDFTDKWYIVITISVFLYFNWNVNNLANANLIAGFMFLVDVWFVCYALDGESGLFCERSVESFC